MAVKLGQDLDQASEEKAKVTEEDIARLSAMILGILDPTGIVATGAAYTYPKCSKLK